MKPLSKSKATVYKYVYVFDSETGETRKRTRVAVTESCKTRRDFENLISTQKDLLGEFYAGSVWIRS